MSVDFSKLRTGSIVWALVRDQRGYRKRRPAIILTPDEDISPDELAFTQRVSETILREMEWPFEDVAREFRRIEVCCFAIGQAMVELEAGVPVPGVGQRTFCREESRLTLAGVVPPHGAEAGVNEADLDILAELVVRGGYDARRAGASDRRR